ncbi:MAG: hypothetical protein ACI4AE_02575 [Candidatus Cryptobacteroides sp.]
MNNLLKYMTMCLGVAAVAVSCSVSAIDDLEGLFPAPKEVKADKLVSSTAFKQDGKRMFTLAVTDGTNTLDATLVGKDYFLTSNTYSAAEESVAKNGNYILGKTKVNSQDVASGTIKIAQNGSNYSLLAVLFLSDGTPYKISWSGELLYEADPEAIHLVKVLSAQSNLPNASTVSMQLASADVDSSFDPNTYQTTYTGDGNYLALDLYSPDGFLHEGTYRPCAVPGTVGEGEYGVGYDPGDIFGWGIVFTNWGTC